jgi:hypothetical protein
VLGILQKEARRTLLLWNDHGTSYLLPIHNISIFKDYLPRCVKTVLRSQGQPWCYRPHRSSKLDKLVNVFIMETRRNNAKGEYEL